MNYMAIETIQFLLKVLGEVTNATATLVVVRDLRFVANSAPGAQKAARWHNES